MEKTRRTPIPRTIVEVVLAVSFVDGIIDPGLLPVLATAVIVSASSTTVQNRQASQIHTFFKP